MKLNAFDRCVARCDGDTTQGSEQSHMHTEDDHSVTAFDRGYEVWLMSEVSAVVSQCLVQMWSRLTDGTAYVLAVWRLRCVRHGSVTQTSICQGLSGACRIGF